MNYETINYAYLAGFLQSELEFLACDEKFRSIKSYTERRNYIDKLIADAKAKAKEYEGVVKFA